METEGKNKKEYELAVLVANEADLARVSVLLREHGAEMTSEPRAKNAALAYEIKGHKEGVFAYCLFNAEPESAKSLERDLASRQDILRALIIASPAAAEKIASSAFPKDRKPRTTRPLSSEPKPAAPQPLSNEALEKKIEEILQ